MNAYLTIGSPAEGMYKEKGSKFLAFAFPVGSEAEIRHHLDDLRKRHYDARHHCYAYVIGLKRQSFRANDDGEPNHSAGDPILGQIRSKGLTNCLVVVVRYFGGTKLGVGGLVTAYKTATEDALDRAELVKIYAQTRFSLTFEYGATSEVERVLSEFAIDYLDKVYMADCRFEGLLRDEDVPRLEKKLELARGVSLKFDQM